MTFEASAAPMARANPIARFTGALFGLVPISLTMLVLRIALALPFLRAGQTDWDDWFVLSFGVKARFADLRLHLFGAEYPFPQPDLMALAAGVAEVALPTLLIIGLGTRYAGARAARHDRRHPTLLPRGLGELPPLLGFARAGDHDLRAGQNRARLCAGPRPALTRQGTIAPRNSSPRLARAARQRSASAAMSASVSGLARSKTIASTPCSRWKTSPCAGNGRRSRPPTAFRARGRSRSAGSGDRGGSARDRRPA